MSYQNIFLISGILITIPNICIILILLFYGNTKLHKIWTLFNTTIGIWGIGCIFVGLSFDYTSALYSWKFSFLGSSFISTTFYHTTLIFTSNNKKLLLRIGYAYSFLFLILNSFFLGDYRFCIITETFPSLYYARATSLLKYFDFYVWTLFAAMGNVELFRFYTKAKGNKKNATLYFLLPMLIGFIGGVMNWLPIIKVDIFPYGNFSVSIYCAIVTYAFLKHNLTDIKVVIKKGVLYSLFLAVLSLIYLLTVVVVENAIQGVLGYQSIKITIVIAFVVGLIFLPFRSMLQNIFEKVIYHGSPTEIAAQNELLRQQITETDKYKTLSTLASGIAHEVKNPLTTIKTFAEYLPRKIHDEEFIKKFHALVSQEVERIDELVHQLLDYGKPAPLSIKPTNINSVITETLEFLNQSFIKKHIRTETYFENPTQIVSVDKNQIKQALMNIVLNAVDAMSNGGILTVETRVTGLKGQRAKGSSSNPLPLKPSTPSCFEIVIGDTGPGIPAKDMKRLFDPFFTQKEDGTGLGLAITQTIIEQHKGKIRVRSEVGKGTEFIIELPLG